MFLRKVFVGLLGTTVLLIGLAAIVLPGPATLIIPLGLVILASEFAFFRFLVRSQEPRVRRALNRLPDSRLKRSLHRMRERYMQEKNKEE